VKNLDRAFGRKWGAPCIGFGFGFVAGSAFSISIIVLREISFLHASQLIYERIKGIEDKISIPGEIVMALLKYNPPYPDGSIPWASIAFLVFSNGAILAMFGLLIGSLYQKHHLTLQTAQSPGASASNPALSEDHCGEKSPRAHWTAKRKGVILGAATGVLLTVGSYNLLSLSSSDSSLAWIAAPGLLLFEPARFLAFKLGCSLNAYPVTWSLLLWGMIVNSVTFMFLGLIIDHSIRAFYRMITSK
jgi:hypothetical protein